MANVKKAFQVEELEGKRTKTVFDYEEVENKKGKKIRTRTNTEVEVDAGWMVYFPNGSSMHVTSMEEMKRLGFADSSGRVRGAPLIDLESGEVVGSEEGTNLKRLSEQVSSRSSAKKKFRDAELGVE